ncbi:hypothetical protein [Zobellia sp. OII3]|uniref:hypothetical protein n=1 Tax=Zobellia sp. OII3 TaxID=2034520 RepID=UPI000F4F0A7A|nr:hypothetical protein [Zobellia sp. OII3]
MKNLLFLFIWTVSHSVIAQLDYESFIGESGKISFSKEYSYANLYDYEVNASKEDSVITRKLSSTIPEGLLTERYAAEIMERERDSTSFEILLKSRLLVDINSDRLCFIKYSTRLNDKETEEQIFKTVRRENKWNVNVENDEETALLEQIFKEISVEMFFEIFNDRDNPDYPELNELKPQIKNENGAIDIKKLATIITENNSIFPKNE